MQARPGNVEAMQATEYGLGAPAVWADDDLPRMNIRSPRAGAPARH
jgi:hypothetical protein